MKIIISFFCALLFGGMAYGQAQEGTITYQKNLLPAAVIELPYSPGVVSSALSDYLSKKGKSKGTDMKGFTTFRNTQPAPNDSVNADLYFKIERKSRKDRETTVISLLTVAKEGASALNNTHYLTMDEAKDYLNNLVPAITSFNLEQRIKDQNEMVAKAESKYKKLTDEGADLEKKRNSLEKRIGENKQQQQAQTSEIELQKQKLASWVAQRKSQ